MTERTDAARDAALARLRGPRGAADDADLAGLDLANADLPGLVAERLRAAYVVLRGAGLARAALKDCDFEGANFAGARLREAAFFDCVLSAADFTAADLRGGSINVSSCRETLLDGVLLSGGALRGSLLHGSTLRGARLDGVDARRASFKGADLTGADCSGGNFEHADFRGARLGGVSWRGARLDGAKFDARNEAPSP